MSKSTRRGSPRPPACARHRGTRPGVGRRSPPGSTRGATRRAPSPPAGPASSGKADGNGHYGCWLAVEPGRPNISARAGRGYPTCCADTCAGSHDHARAATPRGEVPDRSWPDAPRYCGQSASCSCPARKVFESRSGHEYSNVGNVRSRKRNPSRCDLNNHNLRGVALPFRTWVCLSFVRVGLHLAPVFRLKFEGAPSQTRVCPNFGCRFELL